MAFGQTDSMKIRDAVQGLEPYEWEPSSEQIAGRAGISPESVVRFDTSTSPFLPTRWIADLLQRADQLRVNDYPDTSYASLTKHISGYVGKDPNRILVTNGADEGLDLISKLLVDQGCEAIISTPTYSMFRIVVEVMGGGVIGVPRRGGFVDDCDGILDRVTGRTRLIFLGSPNNPTGNTVARETVMRLLEESGCAVVVDEAYYEFSGKTFVDLTDRYENLFIVRTLSKAFGLAGARVGYLVVHGKTASSLMKVRPPNSLGVISLLLAEAAFKDLESVRRNTRLLLDERERCEGLLGGLRGLHVYPSEANFLLIRLGQVDADEVHKRLMARGFVTRNMHGTPMLENCLRIGVRLPQQNDALIAALAEMLGS